MSIFLNAAFQVLSDYDRPLSAEEITQYALDRGILKTRGATPAATMSASLYVDIREKGAASRFVQVGPNRFSINKEPNVQVPYDVRRKPKGRAISKGHQPNNATAAHKSLDREIAHIKAFLGGQKQEPPTSEKICDWITMCYTLELFSEGVDLFNFIVQSEVNEWYFQRTKKMMRLCALRLGNHA